MGEWRFAEQQSERGRRERAAGPVARRRSSAGLARDAVQWGLTAIECGASAPWPESFRPEWTWIAVSSASPVSDAFGEAGSASRQ